MYETVLERNNREIKEKMAANRAINVSRIEAHNSHLSNLRAGRLKAPNVERIVTEPENPWSDIGYTAAEPSDTAVIEVSAELPTNQGQSINDGVIEAVKPEIRSTEGWTDDITEWALSKSGLSFTTAEVMLDCLGVSEPTKAEQMKLSNILKELGYQKKRAVSGNREYLWSKAG